MYIQQDLQIPSQKIVYSIKCKKGNDTVFGEWPHYTSNKMSDGMQK